MWFYAYVDHHVFTECLHAQTIFPNSRQKLGIMPQHPSPVYILLHATTVAAQCPTHNNHSLHEANTCNTPIEARDALNPTYLPTSILSHTPSQSLTNTVPTNKPGAQYLTALVFQTRTPSRLAAVRVTTAQHTCAM